MNRILGVPGVPLSRFHILLAYFLSMETTLQILRLLVDDVAERAFYLPDLLSGDFIKKR
jgi:hypothetical protein